MNTKKTPLAVAVAVTGALLVPTAATAEPLPAPVVLQDRLNDTEWVGRAVADTNDISVDIDRVEVSTTSTTLTVTTLMNPSLWFSNVLWDDYDVELDTDGDGHADHVARWQRGETAQLLRRGAGGVLAPESQLISRVTNRTAAGAGSLSVDVPRAAVGDPERLSLRVTTKQRYGTPFVVDVVPGSWADVEHGTTSSFSHPVNVTDPTTPVLEAPTDPHAPDDGSTPPSDGAAPTKKVRTILGVRMSKKTQRVGKRPTRVSVRVRAAQGQAQGKVRIRVGKQLQRVVTVKRNRTFTVALNRKLKPGTRILRVVFVPAKDSVSKRAKRQRVHVVKR